LSGGGLNTTLAAALSATGGSPGRGSDLAERRTGSADEGDFFAVGREGGVGIAIDAGSDVRDFAGVVMVKSNEAVVGAVGDEDDFFAVGGPAVIRVGSVGAEEGF